LLALDVESFSEPPLRHGKNAFPSSVSHIAWSKSLGQVSRDSEISVQSYYRWRKEYCGLEIERAKRMARHCDIVETGYDS
jgi:hypothetical protein